MATQPDMAARLAWRFGALAGKAGKPMLANCPYGKDQPKLRTMWVMGYSSTAPTLPDES